MSQKFKTVTLKLNQPTSNGRIYPAHIFEREVKRFCENKGFVFDSPDGRLESAIGVIEDVSVRDGGVEIEWQSMDTQAFRNVAPILSSCSITPYGHGKTVEKIVTYPGFWGFFRNTWGWTLEILRIRKRSRITVVEDYKLEGFSLGMKR